jgi:ribosomal protein S18 acetylase RimI-like enzyme
MLSIRPLKKEDIPSLKDVIDSNKLFPSVLLDDMLSGYLATPDTQEIWLTGEVNSTPVAVAYCTAERLTDGTFNLLLIAVHKHSHGRGWGSALMEFIEQQLRGARQRLLIVETSGLAAYRQTRAFYEKLGYTREAVIREFYGPGDDKVIFWKRL